MYAARCDWILQALNFSRQSIATATVPFPIVALSMQHIDVDKNAHYGDKNAHGGRAISGRLIR
jgi:hypothetical protein